MMLLLATDAASGSASTAGPEAIVLGAMAAAVGGGMVAARKRIDQATLIYLLAPVLLFSGFTWMAVALFDPTGESLGAFDFLALQAVSLVLGIAHVWVFYHEIAGWRALEWPERSREWSWKQFGFTVLLAFMGCIGVMVADMLLDMVIRGWNYFPALLTFLVPFVWVKAFDLYTNIPVAVYTPWYPTLDYFTYEPHARFPKATVRMVFDDENVLRVEDVPFDRNLPFECVFRWILHTDLNDQPGTYYSEQDNATYVWGWHFHRQRTSWFRWNRRIDPQRTFRQCRLRNGDTIIALRHPKQEHLDVVRTALRERTSNTHDA